MKGTAPPLEAVSASLTVTNLLRLEKEQLGRRRIEVNPCVRLWMLCVVVACVIAPATAQGAKLNSVLDVSEFVRDWQISKQFTMAVAQAMPADYYSFKATPEEMSFGEQIVHIAGANVFRFKQITGIQPPFEFDPGKPGPTDKETSLKRLEQSFDYVLDVLPKITPEQLQRTWIVPSWKGRTQPDGRAMIMNMFVHTAHHRAQCEVYLRLKGIKPPDYTF